MSEFQIEYDRLAAWLSSVTSEQNDWRFLTRDHGDEIINLPPSLDTFKYCFKLLTGEIVVIQMKTEAVLFERDAGKEKKGRLHGFSSRYQNAYNHVAKAF